MPSPKWVLFGHHLLAIAGAGPLAEGRLWLRSSDLLRAFSGWLIGAVWQGGDVPVTLTCWCGSVRRRGLVHWPRSARAGDESLGRLGLTMIAVLFILLVTLAGLGIVVVNALGEQPLGAFTMGTTIPIALIMGVWMFKNRSRQDQNHRPEHFWVVCLLAVMGEGHEFAVSSYAHMLTFSNFFFFFYCLLRLRTSLDHPVKQQMPPPATSRWPSSRAETTGRMRKKRADDTELESEQTIVAHVQPAPTISTAACREAEPAQTTRTDAGSAAVVR